MSVLSHLVSWSMHLTPWNSQKHCEENTRTNRIADQRIQFQFSIYIWINFHSVDDVSLTSFLPSLLLKPFMRCCNEDDDDVVHWAQHINCIMKPYEGVCNLVANYRLVVQTFAEYSGSFSKTSNFIESLKIDKYTFIKLLKICT